MYVDKLDWLNHPDWRVVMRNSLFDEDYNIASHTTHVMHTLLTFSTKNVNFLCLKPGWIFSTVELCWLRLVTYSLTPLYYENPTRKIVTASNRSTSYLGMELKVIRCHLFQNLFNKQFVASSFISIWCLIKRNLCYNMLPCMYNKFLCTRLFKRYFVAPSGDE